MRCSSCGTDNDAGSKFCMTCGTLLESADAPAPPAAAADPQVDPSAPLAGHDLIGESADDALSGEVAAPSGEIPAAPGAPPAFGAPEPPASAESTAPSEWAAVAAPQPTGAPPAQPGPASWAPPATPQAPAPGAWGAPRPTAPQGPPPGQWGAPQAPGGYQQPGGYPQSGGYPQAGGYQQAPAGPADPNGLGVAASRLDRGPMKKARAAFAVAGAILEEGEQVEAVVSGQFEGNPAVLLLTDRHLVVVDDRPWKPTVERIDVDASLQVQGMQDNRTATLAIATSARQYVIDQIAAKDLAVEMAQRIRYRAGS